MIDLLPFQRDFVSALEGDRYDVAALSIPRGNGKSTLAAHILKRCITPGDTFFAAGAESVLCSASLEQARICFRFLRADILASDDSDDYKFVDSSTKVSVRHKKSKTAVRAISSSGKGAMGLGADCPLAVLDEVSALQVVNGELLWDALNTSLGKPGAKMRVALLGTLAPQETGWYADLIKAGTTGRTYVYSLAGDASKYEDEAELRRVNPLMSRFPASWSRLLAEQAEASINPQKRAAFCSYRLNAPSADASTALILAEDWSAVLARPVPDREGPCRIGADLGASTAWSAAVAVWPNGRTECFALTAGIPDIKAQEKRDRVPAGTYEKLVAEGSLIVAHDVEVPSAGAFVAEIKRRWSADRIVADRFRAPAMRDALAGWVPLEARATMWSQCMSDIDATRSMVKISDDPDLAIEETSRSILAVSLAASRIKTDAEGSYRLSKVGNQNGDRDDCAQALILAAGSLVRDPPRGAAILKFGYAE